ncbi:MAG: ABC transporter permease [Coriobacteriales bacterium]|nr:ABC transporter permease [Coriobacteriales bacterium]
MLIKQYLLPLIKKQKLLFIAMAIMSALTFGMFVGSSYAYDNYKISSDNYFNGYNYPSAFITTDFTSEASFDSLKDVEGVKDYDIRFHNLFNINIDDEYLNVVLNTFKQDDFTKYANMSDYVEAEDFGIYVDQQFADAHNIKAGDTVNLGKNGQFCSCTVSQIVLNPECFCVYALGDIRTDNIGYGSIYLNYDDLEKFLAALQLNTFGLDSNQALLQIDSAYDKQKVLDNCCDELAPKVQVSQALIDEDTPPYILSREFDTQFSAISEVVPLAFLIIMSLIFILFLIQIIKKHSREIGIFLASGYQKTAVYGLFAVYTLLISALSLIVGFILSIFMGYLTYSLYQSGIYFPEWTTNLFFDKVLISSLVIVATGQIACAISALMFIKSSPMDALDKNHQSYVNLGKRAELIIYRIPNAIRLALNSILQNFRNFLVIVLGFIASFVLIFSSFSVYSSMQEYINYTYDVQNNYDAQVVSLSGSVDDLRTVLESSDYVTKQLEYDSIITEISCGDKTKDTSVIGFPSDSDMLQFKDASTGDKLTIPDKGIFIDKLTADALNAKVGDTVEFCDKKFEVKAITAMYGEQYQVISVENMAKIDEEKYVNSLVDVTDKKDFEKFCAYSQYSLHPIFASDFKQMEINFKKSFNLIINIIVIIAILLGFIVVLTVSKMTMERQKRTICILRSQGMSLTAISNYWSIQMAIQLLVAFLLGMPLANLAGRFFVSNLCSDASYFPFIDDFSIYLYAFVFIIGFSILTHLVIVLFISRFNIAQNVQSRE